MVDSKLPDVTTLRRMIDVDKMTHAEIAAQYGLSRQAVTYKLKQAGATTERLRRDWPWPIETRHRKGYLYEVLLDYLADRSKDRVLNAKHRDQLAAFMRTLDTMASQHGHPFVVDYDRATPVGFYFRERRDTDPKDSILGAA